MTLEGESNVPGSKIHTLSPSPMPPSLERTAGLVWGRGLSWEPQEECETLVAIPSPAHCPHPQDPGPVRSQHGPL